MASSTGIARRVGLLALSVASIAAALMQPALGASDGAIRPNIALALGFSLALVVLGLAQEPYRGAARWAALAIAGWGATLTLTYAPAHVAYQHLQLTAGRGLMDIARVVLLVQLGVVAYSGRQHLVALHDWCSGLRPRWLLAVLVIAFVAPSAVPSADPVAWMVEIASAVVVQLLALVCLVAAARELPAASATWLDGLVRRVLGNAGTPGPRRIDRWVLSVAGGGLLISAILARWTWQAHPHVPDEVVYLLHARYFAEGLLTMPLPSVPAGFNLDLMTYEADRWFSPVPPGWPAVLAIGVRLGVPWLVNPVLGAVTVVLAYLLVGRFGNARQARLATLLLAASPWFLFLNMSFMTHAISLACALAAALGIAVSREDGRSWPALLAGFAVGMVSLVRPLEGLICAVLLGFWSLGARGRTIRLLPSASLVVGTAGVAFMVFPYNQALSGSPRVFPLMAYIDKYYVPGSNDLGFGANRGLGWGGLDPFPGHGAIDVVVNHALNTAQVNIELLGWPLGAVALVTLPFLFSASGRRRSDWWMALSIIAVSGAHALYWFSGGPDFGARYWYLIIFPCCVLAARAIETMDERRDVPRAHAMSLLLVAVSLALFVPWRATGKYWHYRGMRPDVVQLARDRDFGRSLVLVRGSRHPDYVSAAAWNPVDLQADAPIYAWDATQAIREQLLAAYPDRPVWILDGPTLTGGAYRVVAGPLTASEVLESSILPDAAGDAVSDPVFPPSRGAP